MNKKKCTPPIQITTERTLSPRSRFLSYSLSRTLNQRDVYIKPLSCIRCMYFSCFRKMVNSLNPKTKQKRKRKKRETTTSTTKIERKRPQYSFDHQISSVTLFIHSYPIEIFFKMFSIDEMCKLFFLFLFGVLNSQIPKSRTL